jgi:hypothetical protein
LCYCGISHHTSNISNSFFRAFFILCWTLAEFIHNRIEFSVHQFIRWKYILLILLFSVPKWRLKWNLKAKRIEKLPNSHTKQLAIGKERIRERERERINLTSNPLNGKIGGKTFSFATAQQKTTWMRKVLKFNCNKNSNWHSEWESEPKKYTQLGKFNWSHLGWTREGFPSLVY